MADPAKPLNSLALGREKNHDAGLGEYVIKIDGRPLVNYLRSNGQGDLSCNSDDLELEDFWWIAGLDHSEPEVNWAQFNGRIPVLFDFYDKKITVLVSLSDDQIIWSDFMLGGEDGQPFNAPPLRFSKEAYFAFTKEVSGHGQAQEFISSLMEIPDKGLEINQLLEKLRSLKAPVRQIVMDELALDRLPEKGAWGRNNRMLFLILFWLACALGSALISIRFLYEGTTEALVVGLIGLTVSLLMLPLPLAGLLDFLGGPATLLTMTPEGLSVYPDNDPIPWNCIAGYGLVKQKSRFKHDTLVIRLAPGFEPDGFRTSRRARRAPGEICLILSLLDIEPTVSGHFYNLIRHNLAARYSAD